MIDLNFGAISPGAMIDLNFGAISPGVNTRRGPPSDQASLTSAPT
jgi:hypothetical protein